MGRDAKNRNRPSKPLSEEDKLDDALDDSFPASDPPSQTDPLKHLGSGKKSGGTRPALHLQKN